MVITTPPLLVGDPSLEYAAPVVHTATNPEVWCEGPFGPALFLAAARDAKLNLDVEWG
jgi:hypothetical protein